MKGKPDTEHVAFCSWDIMISRSKNMEYVATELANIGRHSVKICQQMDVT